MRGLVASLVEQLSTDPSAVPPRRLAGLDHAETEELFQGAKHRVDELLQSAPEAACELAGWLVSFATANSIHVSTAHRARGVAHYYCGRPRDARSDFDRAVQLYEEEGSTVEAAKVRRNLVEIHVSLGDEEAALACADRARSVFMEHGRRDLLAGLDLNVGNIYFRTDRHGRSRVSYEAALEGYQQVEDEAGCAYALFSLANLEMAQHGLDEAERLFRAARSTWDRMGFAAQVADCDYSLALVQSRRGRFAEALKELESVRLHYTETKASGTYYVDLDQAEIYARLNAWRETHDLASRAEAGFLELDHRPESARAAGVAALALLRMGKLGEASERLSAAEAALRRVGNTVQVDVLSLHRHVLRLRGGAASKDAVEALRRIHSRLLESGQRLPEELARLALVSALLHRGEYGAALDLLDRAEAWSSALTRTEVLVRRAEALRSLGRAQEAEQDLELAVQAIETTYSTVPGSDVRLAFFRDRRTAFCRLCLMKIDKGGADDLWSALSLLERSRMRGLLDRLTLVPPDREFAHAREHLDALLVRSLDAELGSWGGYQPGSVERPSEEQIGAAVDAVAGLYRRATIRETREAFEWDEDTARAAVGEDEVLLNYFEVDGGTFVVASDRNDISVARLSCNPSTTESWREHLAYQAAKLRFGSEYRARHQAVLHNAAREVLDAMGGALLEPVLKFVEGRSIVVVPYGSLHGLPFHAMRAAGRHLVETSDVSYAPSLAELLRTKRDYAARHGIVVGWSPEPGLRAGAREVERIQYLFGQHCQVLETDTIRAGVEERVRGAAALHLICHGSFRPGNPLFGGVKLGGGFLTSFDVRRMNLDLDLVGLSGCETGCLLRVAGEELSGLQQAFLQAGARAVLSSLWAVPDEPTADLMEALYAGLRSGLNIRRALSDAQRRLIDRGHLPGEWAAFSLTGNPAVVLLDD